MMKRLFIFLIIFYGNSPAGTHIDIPQDNFSPGWHTTEKSRHFDQHNLFDHIDGGAELFLEFGFTDLIVQNYRNASSEIGLEVYQMESSESALGIYRIKCGRETPIEGIKDRNTGNRMQIMAIKCNYYIVVNNFNGSDKMMPIMVTALNQTLESVAVCRPVMLFDYLPQDHLIPGSEFLIRGPYSLMPIYTFGDQDVLLLGGKVFGVGGDYKIDDSDIFTQIIIIYPDRKYAVDAFTNLVENLDVYLKLVEKSEFGFIFIDYKSKYGQIRLEENLMRITINMTHEPN